MVSIFFGVFQLIESQQPQICQTLLKYLYIIIMAISLSGYSDNVVAMISILLE